ncbi:CsbD family protein [uncultured Ligilactobacillus sp.]|uniref:CsbD family protein n=1 Tax=uncultured Ligilactobacillus sp. TaxID=2837633 RepID=UPI00272A2AC5|nr:CsbD family protein [uncultured Ligilactobacillus sp.]
MSKLDGFKDEVVGKVKETEGKLTGDKVRETQGKGQGLVGKAKLKAEELKDDVKAGVDELKEKFDK